MCMDCHVNNILNKSEIRNGRGNKFPILTLDRHKKAVDDNATE